MVEDPGNGGDETSDYQSFGGKVTVEVTDNVSYYQESTALAGDVGGASSKALSPMGMMITNGLAKVDGDAGVFAEGRQAARLLGARLSDFQNFMNDVISGVRNMGSAAAVVAELFEGADNQNGASMNDIAFAFSDSRATAPGDFRKVESWAEYGRRMAENTPQPPMSSMGDEGATSVSYPANGYKILFFPDGSTKTVTTTSESAATAYQSGAQVVTTVVKGPDGQVISSTTDRSYTVKGQTQVQVTAVTRGDDKNGSTSKTTTSTDQNGLITVTNESVSTTDGKKSEPVSTTTSLETGTHRKNADAGPVEAAVERLDTYGGMDTEKQLGRGY